VEDLQIGNYNKCSVEDILSRRDIKYSVSSFQRDYAWKRDEWNKLLDDIFESLNEKRKHFFGFMTFYKPSSDTNEFQIIEGQQRLATITILAAVIRDMLMEKSSHKWKEIDSLLIKTVDTYSDDTYFKLELSDMNNRFFKEHIQNEGVPKEKISKMKKERRVKATNRLIRDCYCYFYDKLKDKEQGELLNILRQSTREFIVITTEVSNLRSAYILFQTLNDRGLDLTLSDLLKTHLFCMAGDQWREIKKDWDYILNLPGIENMNTFLRHYWLSTRGIVKETELFDKLSKEIINKTKAFQFIEELKKEADAYSILLDPRPADFNGSKIMVELLKDELYILSKQQVLPLLLAAYGRFSVKEMLKLIKATINFIFRYLTIGEQENKELERLFSEVAKNIRENRIKNAEAVKKEFIRKDIKDKTFEELFKVKQIKENKKAVYILTKIEQFLSGKKEKFAADITLEHILPINPDEECEQYMKENDIWEEREELVYRIGNMTLLLGKVNKKAQNRPPTIKSKEIYSKETKLKINADLKNITMWGNREIEKRQQKFVKIAQKIWKL